MPYYVEEQDDHSWDVYAADADGDSYSGISSKTAAVKVAQGIANCNGTVIIKYLDGSEELA